jgi:hypothetical protein
MEISLQENRVFLLRKCNFFLKTSHVLVAVGKQNRKICVGIDHWQARRVSESSYPKVKKKRCI